MTLMMVSLLAFVALGFLRRPNIGTHMLIGLVVVGLASAIWFTERI